MVLCQSARGVSSGSWIRLGNFFKWFFYWTIFWILRLFSRGEKYIYVIVPIVFSKKNWKSYVVKWTDLNERKIIFQCVWKFEKTDRSIDYFCKFFLKTIFIFFLVEKNERKFISVENKIGQYNFFNEMVCISLLKVFYQVREFNLRIF